MKKNFILWIARLLGASSFLAAIVEAPTWARLAMLSAFFAVWTYNIERKTNVL